MQKISAETQAAQDAILQQRIADAPAPPVEVADNRPWWEKLIYGPVSSSDITASISEVQPATDLPGAETVRPITVVERTELPDLTPDLATLVPPLEPSAELPPVTRDNFENDNVSNSSDGPVNSEAPRPTFSDKAITLQEETLREKLQEQAIALQNMSETLNDDAVARGIAACDSTPSGRLCRSYLTYNVAVQTELAKYEEIAN